VFEKLHFPEHEAALLAALGEEEDEELYAYIARTLVLDDSEKGLARARKAAEELEPCGEHDALANVLMLQEMLNEIPTMIGVENYESMPPQNSLRRVIESP
jgi:glycine cleavage system pyridoxal-binding protein P